MTDRQLDAHDERRSRDDAATTILARALQRARWTILWERLWPALASIATAIGVFLALSWLGVWLWLPPLARAIGLFACLALIAVSAVPLLFVRLPSKADALRRLDRLSGVVHRPATAMADTLAAPADDPLSSALWRAHVERAIAAARALRAGMPAPKVPVRDPYAIRAAVLILAVAAFFGAGGERWSRIGAAFDWRGVVAPKNFRVDAWVTPPPYTTRPPILLPGVRPGEQTRAASFEPFSVPSGSTLVVRATGSVQVDLATKGGLKPAAPEDTAKRPIPGAEEHRFAITGDGSATLRGVAGGDVTWMFQAVPDKPPAIALTKEPERQARGSLQLLYKVEDDYGVVGAQATFAQKSAAGKDAHVPRPLYGAPDFPLSLPQARTRKGTGQTTKDLTEHPWAGTDVLMTLTARDDGGNEGRSEAQDLRLPERVFVKPMARALIEQRRNLALDAEARADVLVALEALTIAPERFETPAGVYLGLRSIYWQLGRAKKDDELRDAVARLWSMAIGIEDGNLSDVEKALRAAQEALREALERGASEEELKKLMDQLRAAMDRFLQALAEQMRKNPEQMARPLDPNTRMMRPQDLRSMLDQMEKLARSGNRDAARQMLDQLQQMLENLQMARPGQQDGGDDMNSALDQLGDMIRRQQQLRDRTFREGQNQRNERRRGQHGDQNRFGDLQRNQQGLRDQLRQLMEQLRQHGLGQQPGQPGDKGDDGMGELGRAGEEMGSAEGQLGEGDGEGAVGSQGRALEALRRGAQGMAQAMQQGQGQGPGPGQPGRLGRSRADQETDPLGRPLRGRDYGDDSTVKVPGEIDVQRARRILEELRRRFGESFRPQLELDYIERLLKDF
ncbi:MAG: TIGR02302 family protein [Rhizobiales bacterium]|nr:TIGR02302 family protein [Hyphomicrobiales bacterium]